MKLWFSTWSPRVSWWNKSLGRPKTSSSLNIKIHLWIYTHNLCSKILFLFETSALKVAVKADCLDAGEQTIKAATLTLTLTPEDWAEEPFAGQRAGLRWSQRALAAWGQDIGRPFSVSIFLTALINLLMKINDSICPLLAQQWHTYNTHLQFVFVLWFHDCRVSCNYNSICKHGEEMRIAVLIVFQFVPLFYLFLFGHFKSLK